MFKRSMSLVVLMLLTVPILGQQETRPRGWPFVRSDSKYAVSLDLSDLTEVSPGEHVRGLRGTRVGLAGRSR